MVGRSVHDLFTIQPNNGLSFSESEHGVVIKMKKRHYLHVLVSTEEDSIVKCMQIINTSVYHHRTTYSCSDLFSKQTGGRRSDENRE